MLLVLSITFVIKIYGVVWVQLTHFSSADWKDIFIAHVIIIIKSEVSTFPIVIIFFRGRVSEMFVTSYSVTYCIYIPGKLGFSCRHLVQCMMSANSRIRYIYLYILSSVGVRLNIFSYPLFNLWGCMFTVYPTPSWYMREYIALSYYHHQIGNMNYCPLFRVRSWNNGMRCMSLYILMTYIYSLFLLYFHVQNINLVQLGTRHPFSSLDIALTLKLNHYHEYAALLR